ncbi:MAG: helix-turn-helix domain-containing protein [Chloroflexota bacterium]|nr:helix-turn-helix domain-containing protein [Chloroflexota bacterium]
MLGDIVKAQRSARRWTQRELAQRAGIGQAHISMLERNRVPAPGLDTVQALAGAFGLPVNALLEAAGLPGLAVDPPHSDSPRSHLDYWVKTLVALGPQLTSAQRLAVLDHAEALQGQNSK